MKIDPMFHLIIDREHVMPLDVRAQPTGEYAQNIAYSPSPADDTLRPPLGSFVCTGPELQWYSYQSALDTLQMEIYGSSVGRW